MKTITESQRLSLVGLLTIGQDLSQQLTQVEQTMMKIVGEDSEIGAGHCSDSLYGYPTQNKVADADNLIKKMNLTVIPD